MSHDQSYPVEIQDIEKLLNKWSDADEDVSDGALELVCRFLQKAGQKVSKGIEQVCGKSQEVNYQLLQKVLKCLQLWAFSPVLNRLFEIGVIPLLATLFDNFVQSEYSRSPEVLASVLELLFVVEDMSESNEGKIQCGKLFLTRLLAFATTTTTLPSVRLQRAVVETTCALVTKSPENQLAVLDQKVECNKLFKSFLPRCGDFQLQASIMEIFYRLVKRGPQLLDLVQDEAVRKSIESLLQSKKPDLLSEIRTIVTRLNESLGHARSVYSFPAERILVNGHSVTTTDKWVNFGKVQLSFFISGPPDSKVDDPSIIDFQYEDIVDYKRSSRTLLETSLRPDVPGLSGFKAISLESGTSAVVQAQFFFSAADLSNIEANVFPEIRASLEGRLGRKTSNVSECNDKSTRNLGSERGPSNFDFTVHATNTNSHPRNGVSSAWDRRFPKREEGRGPNERSSFDCMHTPPDVVSQTPPDLETLEGISTQDYALFKSNKALHGMTSNRPQTSKPPGRQTQGCRQPVATVQSTSKSFNPPVAVGQPFRRGQEDMNQLQNNTTEPADAHHLNMSERCTINLEAHFTQSHCAANIAAKDSNDNNQRTSKPSRLETHNAEDLSGHKTKSQTDLNLRARVIEISDDETTDGTDDQAHVDELRMKKRQDPRQMNLALSDSPPYLDNKKRSAGNTTRLLNDAELQEVQRSTGSSEKNLVASPRDMLGSDSVMTDIRERHVTNRKATETCQKSSRAVLDVAKAQAEAGTKPVSRTLGKRKCKKTTSYFDADDELSSQPNDSLLEFTVATEKKREKKCRGTDTDPIFQKSAEHRAKDSVQLNARCGRRGSIPEKSKTVRQRNSPPNKQSCLQKTSTIVRVMSMPVSVTRKQSCSTTKQANHAGKVVWGSSSRKDLVQDVFCFTANLAEEEHISRKAPLALKCKARRNSDYAQPYRKRRRNPAGESQAKVQSMPRQQSCISEGPCPVLVKNVSQTTKSPPRASPAGSASPKNDEITPEQPGAKSAGTSPLSPRLRDSDGISRFPMLRTQKTYTKSDKIITKDAKRERWKDFSIRKLELPTVDCASHDEFSDDETPEKSPYAVTCEVEDLSPDSDDSSGIGMIEKLMKSFKQKVKLVEQKKVGDILSNTMQRISREVQSAEEQVREDRTDFLDTCKKKSGHLDSQLQEQVKEMREMYNKFQQDFSRHLERHNITVGEIEEAELELNDLAKQQGQNHKDLFSKLKESCKNYLADADQKILDVGKGLTGMRGLKDALQGVLKDF